MFVLLILSLALIAYIFFEFKKELIELYQLNRKCVVNLKKLEGPPHLPIIGSAHLFKWNNLEFTQQLEEWGRTYLFGVDPSKYSDKDDNGAHFKEGHIGIMPVWIGPVPVVFLGTHESIRPVLESTVNISKPAQYNKNYGMDRFGASDKHPRKMNYYPIFVTQGEILTDMLEKHCGEEDFFDCFGYVKRCALDIICETAMGTQVNAQIGENNTYVKAVERVSEIIWDHERFPWYWLKPIWYLSGMGHEFHRNVKLTTDFTRTVIAERKAALKEMDDPLNDVKNGSKMAFLDLMLKMQEENQLTDEDIREEVDTFMFEGHDTTASSMGFTMMWLGLFPECQKKLHEELDSVFGDSDRPPTMDDIKKLVYLEKCIKEALRLFPSVPIIARRLSEDCFIDHPRHGKICLPSGLTVAVAPLATSRDPRYYEKPDEFNPEHFNADQVSKRDPYTYIPFSAGSRNCIGQKFAITEEKVVLSWVFRRFSVESENSYENLRPVPELILRPSNGIKIKIKKREF
ncbi:unnamed protein product [Caenorhabditis auriculariae]|uniref:CYtochrome P450 family n=1 Tax=Caenorhabditis auriculariae TaxID=2777116 RepID=A0A8S1H437_9PELO|nr:unnamed protein product [Caenorhabditis auriculariae]